MNFNCCYGERTVLIVSKNAKKNVDGVKWDSNLLSFATCGNFSSIVSQKGLKKKCDTKVGYKAIIFSLLVKVLY